MPGCLCALAALLMASSADPVWEDRALTPDCFPAWLEDRLCIAADRLRVQSCLTAAPTWPHMPGKRRSTPQPIPRCEVWFPHARSSGCVGILLGKAVPGEVWVCRHTAGGCELVCFGRLCDHLAPGIVLATINMVWVLVLYFDSRLMSSPAGQASFHYILWCPRE